MRSRATLWDLQEIIQHQGIHLIPSLEQVEKQAFISMLLTTLSRNAVNRQLYDGIRKEEAILFVSNSVNGKNLFDFPQLPRAEIIRELEAGSGLESDICGQFLESLEEHIVRMINVGGEFEVERLGIFEKRSDEGYQLQLLGA